MVDLSIAMLVYRRVMRFLRHQSGIFWSAPFKLSAKQHGDNVKMWAGKNHRELRKLGVIPLRTKCQCTNGADWRVILGGCDMLFWWPVLSNASSFPWKFHVLSSAPRTKLWVVKHPNNSNPIRKWIDSSYPPGIGLIPTWPRHVMNCLSISMSGYQGLVAGKWMFMPTLQHHWFLTLFFEVSEVTGRLPNHPVVMDDRFTGWWYTNPSEKYEFVSWDDFSFPSEWKVIIHSCSSHHQADIVNHPIFPTIPRIPNMESHKSHVPNHQPV